MVFQPTQHRVRALPWLAEIPEGWDVVPVRSIFYESDIRSEKGEEDLLSVSQYTGITKRVDGLDIEIDNLTNAATLDGYKVVKKNDLVINIMLAWNGSLAVSNFDGITSPAYAVFKVCPDNFPWFYHYLFSTDVLKTEFKRYSTGIIDSRLRLYPDMFLRVNVIRPSFSTQKAITEYLDRKCEQIKKFIEDKKKMIELLKEEILSLATMEQYQGKGTFVRICHLVTQINREVTIERDKEYVALGLYNRGRGLFHKESQKGIDMGDSNFFYVKEGDLILSGQFAWEGAVTMASAAENNCVVSHRYPILIGKKIETEYLLALLMTDFGDSLLNESSRGSAGRNRPLNINILLSKKIRVPSIEVQNEIKTLFYKKKCLEDKMKQQIEFVEEYKKSLIYHAVTGKITI